MSPIKNLYHNLVSFIKANATELWASLSIFVGLPLVAYLYFDYRAAITTFVTASIVVCILAMRK